MQWRAEEPLFSSYLPQRPCRMLSVIQSTVSISANDSGKEPRRTCQVLLLLRPHLQSLVLSHVLVRQRSMGVYGPIALHCTRFTGVLLLQLRSQRMPLRVGASVADSYHALHAACPVRTLAP